MNRQETAAALVIMRTIWPNIAVDDATIQAWQWALGDMPMTVVEPELKRWMRTSPFPPKPSEILALIAERVTGLPTPGEAWGMVQDRIAVSFRPGVTPPPWDIPEAVREAQKQTGKLYDLRRSEYPGADEKRFLELYGVIREKAIQAIQLNGIPDHLLPVALGRASVAELAS